MRRRVLFSSLMVGFAALAVLFAGAALPQRVSAQQATTISISTGSLQVGDLLQQGRQLELQRRWGEALAHYEDAMRLFPGESLLQRRFELARSHYDLERRYADRSYLNALVELPPAKALDLYGDVLLKIQVHYVEVPSWQELVDRGTDNLDVALSERSFVERNLPQQSQAAVDAFRRELHDTLAQRVVRSRSETREAAATAAQLAQQRLQIPPTAVVLEYMCGATNTLDAYSAYLTPNQLNEVYSQIEGNFVGLGIELKAIDGKLSIVRVIPGSPAEQAGIRPGDRIASVDGQSTADLSTDEAANLLQGEAGTVVELTVAHPPLALRRVSVCRRRVDVPSIDHVRILDANQGVAYLHLACFQKTTSRDLEEALWKLHHDGMKCLIIDLRGNPGGLLVTAVEVVDKFVGAGVIVSTRGRSLQEDFTYSAHSSGTWRVPLVVLIDQDSASAAEILAGAIRDHRRGTIVGVRSFGKGSVQGIFPLDFSSAGVRLTTARFYSPSGRPYSRVGVEPHLQVHHAARPIDGVVAPTSDGEDPMLTAALEAARELRQRR